MVTTHIEPFIPSSITRPLASGGLWPHAIFASPLNLYFAWPDSSPQLDSIASTALAAAAKNITEALRREGQPVPGDGSGIALYPNYASAEASTESMYGAENARKAKLLRKEIDPEGLMLRTGGFKFV